MHSSCEKKSFNSRIGFMNYFRKKSVYSYNEKFNDQHTLISSSGIENTSNVEIACWKCRGLGRISIVIRRTHFVLSGRRPLSDHRSVQPMKMLPLHRLHLDTDTKKSTSRRNMLKHNISDTVCVQMYKHSQIYKKPD